MNQVCIALDLAGPGLHSRSRSKRRRGGGGGGAGHAAHLIDRII